MAKTRSAKAPAAKITTRSAKANSVSRPKITRKKAAASKAQGAPGPTTNIDHLWLSDFVADMNVPDDIRFDLDNQIHAIFKKSNFPPGVDYEALRPSARLATRILGTDTVMSVLYTIVARNRINTSDERDTANEIVHAYSAADSRARGFMGKEG